MQRPLFWKSHCAICSPVYVILYHVTGSCKGPIQTLAYVAGGMRERASGGGAAIFLSGEAREEFASGEAASEFPACHISYGFCLPPTFIAFDESIK